MMRIRKVLVKRVPFGVRVPRKRPPLVKAQLSAGRTLPELGWNRDIFRPYAKFCIGFFYGLAQEEIKGNGR